MPTCQLLQHQADYCSLHPSRFPVAELKAKAAKAKDASVSKVQSVRDRNTRYFNLISWDSSGIHSIDVQCATEEDQLGSLQQTATPSASTKCGCGHTPNPVISPTPSSQPAIIILIPDTTTQPWRCTSISISGTISSDPTPYTPSDPSWSVI